ncbi:MAG: hypothetical protein HYZ93_03150 [Candidatus Omnitrophica bacterium]|nr:hypothetical protein [Candidatus Omnitrophota bacterium]
MMNSDSWLRWLERWLKRYPVQEPPEFMRYGYTEEVLNRVRAAGAPAPLYRWIPAPKASFALGTLMAGLLVGLVLVRGSGSSSIEQEIEILEQVDADDSIPTGEEPDSEEGLMEELRESDEADLAVS